MKTALIQPRWIMKSLYFSHSLLVWVWKRFFGAGEVVNTNEISWRKLFILQVPQKNVYSAAPKPNYAPVISKQPPKAQQQQRPVSIHSFSSLQSQAPPSKPLSPLPLLQTNSPQFQSPVHGSPRGWSHVDSPRSPGAGYQQPKNYYNTAPIASPPFELTNSTSTSSFGQPQVRSRVSLAEKKSIFFNIGRSMDWKFWLVF